MFTVVAFCATWNGGGVLWATSEIITSVPAGVYLFPNPRQRFALRIWPGTIQVSRSRGMPLFNKAHTHSRFYVRYPIPA